MAMIAKKVPNVVLAQRVVDKIMLATSRFMVDETGEAMVGLVVEDHQTQNPPTIYVLETISPDETAIREMHTFQQGDELQDEIIWWLQENWAAVRRKRGDSFGRALQAKWDAPLRYLGDWHKQPGFMIKPSFGDLQTALDWLDDEENDTDFLLVPIATLGHPSTTSSQDAQVNYISVPLGDGTDLRIDFWYIHRDIRMFQPVNVSVCANDQLPGLTKYPWHLVKDDRYHAETAQLQGDGLFISVTLWDVDGKLPLEVCFLAARRNSDKMLVLITPWDYPESPPSARVAPFVHMDSHDNMQDVFERVWAQSTQVKNPSGWHWQEDLYLVDYLHAVEDSLGLIRPAQPVSGPDAPDGPEREQIPDEADTSEESA